MPGAQNVLLIMAWAQQLYIVNYIMQLRTQLYSYVASYKLIVIKWASACGLSDIYTQINHKGHKPEDVYIRQSTKALI